MFFVEGKKTNGRLSQADVCPFSLYDKLFDFIVLHKWWDFILFSSN